MSSALPQTMPASSPRRVLSREAAIAIGQEVIARNELLWGVRIEHVSHSVTKVANGSVLEVEDGDVVKIGFPSRFGSGLDVWITTNQLDETVLMKVVDETVGKMPKIPPRVSPLPPEPVDTEGLATFADRPRALPAVSLYHSTTVDAMDATRGVVIPEMVAKLRASNLTGAATVRLMSRAILGFYRNGLTSFADETDSEVTVTARTPDGKASGWNGQAHRDWAKIDTSAITERAIEMANMSRNPVALEPGRRVAILGPAAVAQLVYMMGASFDFPWAGSGPFGYSNLNRKGRHTKMGQRVFDPRIMMVSDPADPDGGYPPFFDVGGKDFMGFPTPKATWINNGILERLAMNINDAALRNLTPAENPYGVRLAPVPGTKTTTVEEMIANCQEGVYVNRFSDLQELDQKTGMMTGVTRDGCFLVKNGKIAKALANFRFTESPFFAFNQLEMIGEPERVAFGNAAGFVTNLRYGLPRLPVIVPPMMIKDFNFSALANSV